MLAFVITTPLCHLLSTTQNGSTLLIENGIRLRGIYRTRMQHGHSFSWRVVESEMKSSHTKFEYHTRHIVHIFPKLGGVSWSAIADKGLEAALGRRLALPGDPC